jgi:hypothetical protein
MMQEINIRELGNSHKKELPLLDSWKKINNKIDYVDLANCIFRNGETMSKQKI